MNKDYNIELLKQEIKKKTKKQVNPLQPYSYISTIHEYNFFCENSIHIQQKLREILHFPCHFYCLQEWNYLSIKEINENNVEKRNINKKYVLFKYIKILKIPFIEYFSRYTMKQDIISSKKNYIRDLLNSYEKLLNTIIKLNKKGICYFHWKKENIFFDEKEFPILENFEKSIVYSSLTCDYIIKIIDYSIKVENKYNYLPIEVFIIYYIHKYDYTSLSFHNLEEIYVLLKKNFHLLSLEEFTSSFQSLVNRDKKYIISYLFKFISTWDNYGLSILYLEYLEDIVKKNPYDTKYHIIPKLISNLKKNTSNIPFQRENVILTQETFYNLISTF
jgi:hypothetical protein